MCKAEEKGYEAYPVSFYEGTTVDVNEMPRDAFIEGYHQAEKDLELTWKDFAFIRFAFDVTEANTNLGSLKICTKEYYQEVLKRFKDLKKGKRNE